MSQEGEQVTSDILKSRLRYEPTTGKFFWLPRSGEPQWNGRYAGKQAGMVGESGYVIIGVDGRLYRAHRLAWLYMNGEWPIEDVDHINGCRDDNRIVNLRAASRSQNLANSWRRENSISGLKGVSRCSRGKAWQAHIKKDGRSIALGRFYTPEEAHAAYVAAAITLFGEFARTE